MGDVTRWTVNVAPETDIEVRTYLAQRGMTKGDLSRFIEEAVKWRLFDLTLAEATRRISSAWIATRGSRSSRSVASSN